MNCPECDGRTGVSDTRHKDYGNYRIRKCNNCGYIFSTVEIIRNPLNKYDIENFKDIANVCDEAARTLEKALIPPLNIGQELWDIHYNKPRKWEVVYLGYNGKEWHINIHWWKDRYNFKTLSITYPFVGKMWYLSKEEAEQKLANRRQS